MKSKIKIFFNLVRRKLHNYSALEKILRKTFLFSIYCGCGRISFRLFLAPNILIKTAEKWAELHQSRGTCFFGYYDKSPWNRNGDTYLSHHLTDNKNIELVALRQSDSTSFYIGKTEAWTYQQGAMLQWLPGAYSESVIYNTIQNSEMGCCLQDINTSSKRFIPWPVQAVHPDGHSVISLNYSRLMKMNPEYGYSKKTSNFSSDMPLKDDGLWLVNLNDGDAKLIINLESLLQESHRDCMDNAQHGVNHVIFSPDGDKFIFIHRWLTKNHIRYSRLFMMDLNLKSLKLLLDENHVSHYCWLNNDEILIYAGTFSHGKRYYNLDVTHGHIQTISPDKFDLYGDGHPGLSPDGKWIVTDSYPDAARVRRLLLWNMSEEYLVEVGRFFSSVRFENEKRCDLHPRWHPKKPLISIDSVHEGVRKSYVVDVQSIVGSFNE